MDALLADVDVVAKIGRLVVAQSLLTRDEAAMQMAAELRARALRGETLLLGMLVWFAQDGCEGEYVGVEEDSEQGCYTIRFGTGVAGRTERMYLALMEPDEWSVCPCWESAEACDGIVEEGIPPSK